MAMTSIAPRISGSLTSLLTVCRRSVRWVALLVPFLSLFPPVSQCASTSNGPKEVLILMQEGLSWPLFREIEVNIRAALQRSSPDGIVIYSEYMDRIHFPDPEIQRLKTQWIKRKYANCKLNLMIGVGDVPLDIFPSVPLVYLSPNPIEKAPRLSAMRRQSSTIWVQLGAGKTLEAALKIQPGARHLVIIGGSTPSEVILLNQVREQVSRFSSWLPTTYITDSSVAEIRNKMQTLGPDTIVLFVTMSRDGDGRQLISADAISKIAADSGTPIYSLIDTHLGSGSNRRLYNKVRGNGHASG